MIDYRELLKKYIHHVLASEGLTFLGEGEINPGFQGIEPEDIAELQAINAEVLATYRIGELP